MRCGDLGTKKIQALCIVVVLLRGVEVILPTAILIVEVFQLNSLNRAAVVKVHWVVGYVVRDEHGMECPRRIGLKLIQYVSALQKRDLVVACSVKTVEPLGVE